MSKKRDKKAAQRVTSQKPAIPQQPMTARSEQVSSSPGPAARPAQTSQPLSSPSTNPALVRFGIAFLIGLFLLTRLINLSTYPLHGDEATYIYWGQIAATSPELRLISMWGGRQPLHTWLVALIVPLVNSILVPARLISVVFGGLTALGVYLLARKLFSTRVAFIATLFYLVSPYTTQFDRQVFQDGMISAEAIWTLYLSVLIFERPRWLAAIGLGGVIGAAALTKSTSWLFLPLILFCLLPFPPESWKTRIRQAVPYFAVALGIGGALYFLLFGSSPEAQQLGEWAAKFTYSFSELLKFPVSAWLQNLAIITRWMGTYLTIPLFLMLFVALALTVVWLSGRDAAPYAGQASRRDLARKALLLAIWGFVPTVAHILLAKTLYARYIVFVIPPFLILLAVVVDDIGSRLAQRPAFARFKPSYITGGLVLLLIAVPAYQTCLLLFAPQNFNYDPSDRSAYYDSALWAAGPLAENVRSTANGQPTTLLTNYGMNAVLIGEVATLPHNETVVHPVPLWPVNNNKIYPFDPFTLKPYAPEQINAMRQGRVLYASVPGEEGPMTPFIQPIADFPDKIGKVAYRLYTIDFERYLAWLNQ